MRLDQTVAARFPDISRRKARELIAQRRVLVNDRPVAAASREIPDDVRIVIVDELPQVQVIRETAEWIAINKQAGLPVQPTRDRASRSLEEILRITNRELWLVHRIDTNTTGVVLFARTKNAAAWLSRLFADRAIRKSYLAVASGLIGEPQTIDAPIEGKTAVSFIRPLAPGADRTLVEATIQTGRTHQIRVHLAAIGHPILGDTRHGSRQRQTRPMLHAWRLEHRRIGMLEASVPDDLIRCAPAGWSMNSP